MTEQQLKNLIEDVHAGTVLDFIGLAITVLSVLAIFGIAAIW